MEAVRYFSNPEVAEEYAASVKWSDGPVCPKCGSVNIGRIKSRSKFQCREKGCRRQFTVKHDTIMEDSPLPIDKWLVAIWMIANCRNGASSCEIARTLGIKQQSAWHLLHRVRYAMRSGYHHRLNGVVECDETFVGGRFKNMPAKRREAKRAEFGHKGKTAVQVFLERGGEVRGRVIPRANRKHLQAGVRQHVEPGAKLYTDAATAYSSLRGEYDHEWVNHMKEYVRDAVHVNSCENFFSLLRRGLKGTYVAVEPKHLERYVDEQAFRFNHRKESDWMRFDRLVRRIVGKRLEYRVLTGGAKR